ncbi:hypothetical protein [Erythrobacter sp. HL-111]|uniref:hypothetical protein n=1 Tax=Erythrobacter sp. HL-111 TaxID=1798193 RepID=UPI0006DA6F43|nr:hypothetical protein [Erythrobacter sp. HL-111]KPP95362.1 MAG: hypothetical protein HLUCCO15_01780 [Erythrobacteraceae bacterium HL-111]
MFVIEERLRKKTDTVLKKYSEFGIELVIKEIKIDGHLTNYKPRLILEAAGMNPNADFIFYIDPDIVVQADWEFFEQWSSNCISLFCDPLWHPMLASHPKKLTWKKIAADYGLGSRDFEGYACAGFIGLPRPYLGFTELWGRLLERLEVSGFLSSDTFHSGRSTDPFMAMDQDVLNLALMASDVPFSLASPENQGIVANGAYIAHAQGTPKPWRGGLIRNAIRLGKRPSYAVRQYWEYVTHPVAVHSFLDLGIAKLNIRFATLISRLFG